MIVDPKRWDLLREGKVKEGLALVLEAHAHDPNLMRVDLGIAYLWTEEYQMALTHFQHRLDIEPFTVDIFFGLAGAAKWCLNDPAGAVQYWREGLPSRFADSGVAISLPLLLYVASILKPQIFSYEEAKRILKRQLQNPRTEKWPGPLAKFVLGRINWDTLQDLCIDKRQSATILHKWRARFYRAVVAFAHGKMSEAEFKDAMHKAADTSRPEWIEQREFLHLIWNYEFFIARYEASH